MPGTCPRAPLASPALRRAREYPRGVRDHGGNLGAFAGYGDGGNLVRRALVVLSCVVLAVLGLRLLDADSRSGATTSGVDATAAATCAPAQLAEPHAAAVEPTPELVREPAEAAPSLAPAASASAARERMRVRGVLRFSGD